MKELVSIITLLSYLIIFSLGYVLEITPLIVISNSMSPTFSSGAVLLVHHQEHYLPNDIISYKIGSDTVTHRIISVQEDIMTVKGDANNSSDLETVRYEQVIGKVVFIIPYVGKFVSLLQTKFVALLLISVLIYELYKVTKLQMKKAYAS